MRAAVAAASSRVGLLTGRVKGLEKIGGELAYEVTDKPPIRLFEIIVGLALLADILV